MYVKLNLDSNPEIFLLNNIRKFSAGLTIKKKKLNVPNIHFNNQQFVEELAEDGVHWSEVGQMRVEEKFRRAIKRFMGEDD